MLPIGERFHISIQLPKTSAKLMVQKIGEDGSTETYHIIGRDRIAIIKNNRPLKEKGVEHKIKWKLIQPVIADIAIVEEIGRHIEYYWRHAERTPYVNPKNLP